MVADWGIATFALLVFLIAHVYMASTMGRPWYQHLKTMVTGYHEERD